MVGQVAMPSSGHLSQSTSSSTEESIPTVLLPSFTTLASATGNIGLPAPYTSHEMSAAETLAALPSSRPSTSHANDHFQDDLDHSDEEGGLSLLDDYGSTQTHGFDLASAQAFSNGTDYTHMAPFTDEAPIPYVPSAALDILNDIQSFSQYTTLDHHVSALEALSMDQDPPPPPPHNTTLPPLPTNILLVEHLNNSGNTVYQHLESMAHSYEDYLNMQDNTAFVNPHLFYLHAFPHKDTEFGLEEAQDDHLTVITREDLAGEDRDYQGIVWSKRMPREEFRSKRKVEEKARLSRSMETYSKRLPSIENTENFFSFRRMDKRHRPWGPHFQLRNMMAVTSRHDIYYAEQRRGIVRTDAWGSEPQIVVDTTKHTAHGSPAMITTLAAMDDVLVAGGFEGEYAVVDLASENGPQTSLDVIRDWAPEAKSYIANHVHLFSDRSSYTPQAVLSLNDYSLRVLDCATNTFKYKFPFKAAVNCSATSPDGRLRVVAGDFPETLITNAETGEILQTLHAHEGDAFACAWADDGVHVASAAQDGTIAVWDARTWKPITILPSELTIPRVLKFSPVGSGPRVLVSAEADDYVTMINATTFDSKQVFDFFGRVGGIDFTPDGQSLFVANSEQRLGGIIELERAGGWDANRAMMGVEDTFRKDTRIDWCFDSDLDAHHSVLCGAEERNRRGLDLGCVDV